MIKRAISDIEYKNCLLFLQGYGVSVLQDTHLFYIEDSKGGILAVAGFNQSTGGMIEPLHSTNPLSTIKLFYFMYGLLSSSYNTISVISSNDKVLNYLKESEGFVKYANPKELLIKEINK